VGLGDLISTTGSRSNGLEKKSMVNQQ